MNNTRGELKVDRAPKRSIHLHINNARKRCAIPGVRVRTKDYRGIVKTGIGARLGSRLIFHSGVEIQTAAARAEVAERRSGVRV